MRWMIIFMLLTACEQRYRYACQNPDNWSTKQCQKPLCEVNQECPEQIFAGSKIEKELNKEATNDCPK